MVKIFIKTITKQQSIDFTIFNYKTQYYGQLRWLDVDELSVGSFEINSARFLFVFGATHLLSLFWSLFVELAQ